MGLMLKWWPVDEDWLLYDNPHTCLHKMVRSINSIAEDYPEKFPDGEYCVGLIREMEDGDQELIEEFIAVLE